MQQRTSPNVIFGQGSMSDEQKAHFIRTGKILTDIDTYRVMKQISNVEGGGGVLAGMYSMGVYEKRDDAIIKKIMSENGIEFDIKDDAGVISNKKLEWRKTQQVKTEIENDQSKKAEQDKPAQQELVNAIKEMTEQLKNNRRP